LVLAVEVLLLDIRQQVEEQGRLDGAAREVPPRAVGRRPGAPGGVRQVVQAEGHLLEVVCGHGPRRGLPGPLDRGEGQPAPSPPHESPAASPRRPGPPAPPGGAPGPPPATAGAGGGARGAPLRSTPAGAGEPFSVGSRVCRAAGGATVLRRTHPNLSPPRPPA